MMVRYTCSFKMSLTASGPINSLTDAGPRQKGKAGGLYEPLQRFGHRDI
jgi:hypothetical protein